ncbi:MAG: HD domain-containing protein [Alphaproteobacteria bacterium]|nr:HD domain-containing protein [Alphaproteobacteria bacterium]
MLIKEIMEDLHKYLSDETAKHSIRVAESCYRSFNDMDMFYFYIIALLHDLIEDSDLSLEDLMNKYSAKLIENQGMEKTEIIFNAVDCLTRRENEKYFDYIKRIMQNKEAKIIKFFDAEDNLARCFLNKNKSLKKRYVKVLNLLMDE